MSLLPPPPEVDEAALLAHLQSRVKGQDEILESVSWLIKRRFLIRRLEWFRLDFPLEFPLEIPRPPKDRPVCSLFFLGPIGAGKSELAKALAEYLFGDEKAMVRFDCAELSGPESKIRLTGLPRVYVDSEKCGQLTRPVMANPRRLILFDEIEHTQYPPIFDLLLQLMGEGRLTDQRSRKTVDFTQCLVILTSNWHAEERRFAKAGGQRGKE